jgi:hypothetical protein
LFHFAKLFKYWVILWAIWKNWRAHQNPWNLAIWFIIQYHNRRIFLFWPKKNFCPFCEFLKIWKLVLRQKNRKITLLAVNNAFFNRYSCLSTFFKVVGWFFDFYCILRISVKFRFFMDYFLSDLWPSKRSC